MIHDLDLLFCILGQAPSEIHANGAAVLTAGPDIVNARLEYASGCVANVTASRVSVEPLRKLRVFSPSGYVSIDLLRGEAMEVRKSATFEKGIAMLEQQTAGSDQLSLKDFLEAESFQSKGPEPLKKELEAFCHSVLTREPPPVTGEDGLNALRLALRIVDIIQNDPFA
jgi:predicted dehydrogenase